MNTLNNKNKPISKFSLMSLIGASGGGVLLFIAVFVSQIGMTLDINILITIASLAMAVSILIMFLAVCINGLAGDLKIFPLDKRKASSATKWLSELSVEARATSIIIGVVLLVGFNSLVYLALLGWGLLSFAMCSLLWPLFVSYVQQWPKQSEIKKEDKYSEILSNVIADSAEFSVIGKIKETANFKTLLNASSDSENKKIIAAVALDSLYEKINIPALLLLEELYPEADAPEHIEAVAATEFWQEWLKAYS